MLTGQDLSLFVHFLVSFIFVSYQMDLSLASSTLDSKTALSNCNHLLSFFVVLLLCLVFFCLEVLLGLLLEVVS